MGSKKSKCQERENFEFRYCRNSKIRTGENRNSLFSPALERNWARSTSSSSLSCARHAAAEKRRKAQKIKIGSADDHRDRWMHTLTDQWIESSLCRRPTTALRRTEIRANKRNSGKWSIPFSKGGGLGKRIIDSSKLWWITVLLVAAMSALCSYEPFRLVFCQTKLEKIAFCSTNKYIVYVTTNKNSNNYSSCTLNIQLKYSVNVTPCTCRIVLA